MSGSFGKSDYLNFEIKFESFTCLLRLNLICIYRNQYNELITSSCKFQKKSGRRTDAIFEQIPTHIQR